MQELNDVVRTKWSQWPITRDIRIKQIVFNGEEIAMYYQVLFFKTWVNKISWVSEREVH